MVKLMDKLPSYYYDDPYVNNLQESYNKSLDQFELDIIDLEKQFFVETATWGLTLWENLLDINDKELRNSSIELRRENILSKIRGRGTSTLDVIKSVAEVYNPEGGVEIEEIPKEYKFFVKFINFKFGSNIDISKLYKMLDEIKPAHLDYDITFSERIKMLIHTSTQEFDNKYITCGTRSVGKNLKNKEIKGGL